MEGGEGPVHETNVTLHNPTPLQWDLYTPALAVGRKLHAPVYRVAGLESDSYYTSVYGHCASKYSRSDNLTQSGCPQSVEL